MEFSTNCTACKAEIPTRHLRAGDNTTCPRCGNVNVVSGSSSAVNQENPILGKFTGVRAWDPKWFHASSALVSFFPAGILWSLNFGRFGEANRMRNSMIAVILGFAVFLSIVIAVDEIPRVVGMAINVAIGIYFYQSQSTRFKDFISQGGIKASYKMPVCITATIVIPLIVLMVMNSNGDMPSSDEPDFAEYQKWSELESQDSLQEALTFARSMYARHPRARLSSKALMFSYMDFGIYDSAAAIIKAYVGKSPDDVEAFSCQEFALAVMEADAENYEQALVHIEHYIKLNPTKQEGYELRAEIRRSAGR